MYLHLGESTIVRKKDIVGIFDLDTTTVMKSSRNYINKAEKEKRADYIIHNDGNLEELYKQVDDVIREVKHAF